MTEDPVEPTVSVNPHGFLSYPTDYVYGFVGDPATNVPVIIGDLMARKVSTEAINIYWGETGVKELSPSGEEYGATARIRRFFHSLGAEDEHLSRVERELGEGNALVGVSVTDDETKQAVVTAFRTHGGYDVRFYDRFTIEKL